MTLSNYLCINISSEARQNQPSGSLASLKNKEVSSPLSFPHTVISISISTGSRGEKQICERQGRKSIISCQKIGPRPHHLGTQGASTLLWAFAAQIFWELKFAV